MTQEDPLFLMHGTHCSLLCMTREDPLFLMHGTHCRLLCMAQAKGLDSSETSTASHDLAGLHNLNTKEQMKKGNADASDGFPLALQMGSTCCCTVYMWLID